MTSLPIESYALIGDCETAALVGRDGSIDWVRWPRFDSQACLAALLGNEQNARWRLAPTAECEIHRRYRADTLVLETAFECARGAVTVIDFMYDPVHKRQLGNFPQAFSHLALVGTALNLGRSAKPVQQRGHGPT